MIFQLPTASLKCLFLGKHSQIPHSIKDRESWAFEGKTSGFSNCNEISDDSNIQIISGIHSHITAQERLHTAQLS